MTRIDQLSPKQRVEVERAIDEVRPVEDAPLIASLLEEVDRRRRRLLTLALPIVSAFTLVLTVPLSIIMFSHSGERVIFTLGGLVTGITLGWWLPDWRPLSRARAIHRDPDSAPREGSGRKATQWVIAGTIGLLATWIPDAIARLTGLTMPAAVLPAVWLVVTGIVGFSLGRRTPRHPR